MHKNRIEGDRDRMSERKIAKSISVKGHGRRSGGVRRRRSDLPREACVVVPVTGLGGPRGAPSAAQESAEDSRWRHEPEHRKAYPTEGPNGSPRGDNGAASRDGHLMSDTRQKTQRELASAREARGEAPSAVARGSESSTAAPAIERQANTERLMEEVCERENLKRALRRVRSNKGSPGIDGMTVDELPGYLREHWPTIRQQLLSGTYQPQPVKRVEIPKRDSGGVRSSAFPARWIVHPAGGATGSATALGPAFSEHSYGFRPGRSAHHAIAQAQRYIADGDGYVVDLDLEKFLRSSQPRQINGSRGSARRRHATAHTHPRVLERGGDGRTGWWDRGWTKACLRAVLSLPVLSNLVLDELDRELERRGHRFVRYADDCNVYVGSARAGQRVMESITHFITTRLKLTVNRAKSAVGRPQARTFLGFSFTGGRRLKRRIAPAAVQRLRRRVRTLTRRSRGVSLEQMVEQLASYLRGWRGYFGFCETSSELRDLDSWIRRRLRCVIWKQWKVFRRRRRGLMNRGLDQELASITAVRSHGPWRLSQSKAMHVAFPNAYFNSLGLPRLDTR